VINDNICTGTFCAVTRNPNCSWMAVESEGPSSVESPAQCRFKLYAPSSYVPSPTGTPDWRDNSSAKRRMPIAFASTEPRPPRISLLVGSSALCILIPPGATSIARTCTALVSQWKPNWNRSNGSACRVASWTHGRHWARKLLPQSRICRTLPNRGPLSIRSGPMPRPQGDTSADSPVRNSKPAISPLYVDASFSCSFAIGLMDATSSGCAGAAPSKKRTRKDFAIEISAIVQWR
jgi:hypothetical protein